jgi:hypothetical protein
MLLRRAQGWDLQLQTQISKDAKALSNICLSKIHIMICRRVTISATEATCSWIGIICHMLKRYSMWASLADRL